MLYVAHNRAIKHDTSLKFEILRPLQFSAFNSTPEMTGQRAQMLKAWEQSPMSWGVADTICSLYEGLATSSPIKEATHYYVEKMEHPPKWGRGNPDWIEIGVIGHHVFGIAA